VVEFYGRHETISEKQDGSLVGRTPGFVVSTVNCLSTIYVLSWLFLSQAIFPFHIFCFHNFSPPLEKSWLRPCVTGGIRISFQISRSAGISTATAYYLFFQKFPNFFDQICGLGLSVRFMG